MAAEAKSQEAERERQRLEQVRVVDELQGWVVAAGRRRP